MAKTRISSLALAPVLFVFATSLVPMGARAQAGTAWSSDSFSAGPSGDSRDALVVAALAGAASVEVTILSLGIWRATQGNGFRPGWAVMEMIWGTIAGLYGASIAVGGTEGNGANAALGTALFGAGLLHICHGIFSLVRGGPGRREGREDRPSVSVDVASVGGGATLTLSGPTPAFF